MEKPYHHGNLQSELIEEGLRLIHEQGRGSFSLRKLAKRLSVSPAACYNHYSSAQELLGEMKQYVAERFCDALKQSVRETVPEYAAVKMGKAYVNFFAANPHYFSFLYDSDDCFIQLTEHGFVGEFEPLRIFMEAASEAMDCCGIAAEKRRDNLVIMWAAAHGLAAMANMKGFRYEGDWGELTQRLLIEKIKLD